MIQIYLDVQFGLTALIHAATNGRLKAVKYLIEKRAAQVNDTDNVSRCKARNFSVTALIILFLLTFFRNNCVN